MNENKSVPGSSNQHVLEFLSTTEFKQYQSVPLPGGLRTPGQDRTHFVEHILGDRIRGKSVLDVGTCYGLFACEAMLRGAREAVGVEKDSEHYEVARGIARLHGDSYRIVHGTVEELDFDRKFDVVLFLNVLHHVLDPVLAIRTLTNLCSDTLIVEFCTVPHAAVMQPDNRRAGPMGRLKNFVRYKVLQIAGRGIPLMAVAGREYETFFMSREAFYNTFVLHNKLFLSVEFVNSFRKDRAIAICKPRR